ncbi:MAG: PEP/pyruvate-binding domain-containing protein [Nibricoccus sp.]
MAEARALIEGTDVDPELLATVHAKIQATAPNSKWILRSSTNAEDLAGFSGAGLYRSVVVKAGATPEQLAKAIREVWASVWLSGSV